MTESEDRATLEANLRRHAHALVNGGTNASELKADLLRAADALLRERPTPQPEADFDYEEALRDPIRAALRDLLFTTCESECSPYISQPCGAKFCSYEAMADHLKARHPDFDPAARPGQADPPQEQPT